MDKIKLLVVIFYLFAIYGCKDYGVNEGIPNSFHNCSNPCFTKDSKHIVYSKTIQQIPSGRGFETISEIFISDINGYNTKQITFSNGHSFNPIFSPNELYIYYQFEKDDNVEINRINYDGSNRIRLTEDNSRNYIYDISHDGSKILFYSGKVDFTGLYIMDFEGKNITRLTYINEYISRAEFLPNDSQIIFSYGNKIYKMNVDRSNIQSLMNKDESGDLPNLSIDGTKIVYVSFSNNWGIYTMDIDGGNKIKLTTNNYFMDFSPSLSSDGKKIVFCSDRDGNEEIYKMNSDGSEQKRLTNNEGYDEFPLISPDGSKIAYRTERSGIWYLAIMDIDGGNMSYLISK